MELQRYEMGDYCSGYVRNDDGDVCMSYDVERLEKSNAELLAAAKSVVERWDSPLWKEQGHTGTFIERLREAIAKSEGTK